MLTAPAETPVAVTLDQAKLHLRVDASDEDELISSMVLAATQAAEHQLGRALVTQTWKLSLDSFPNGSIALARPPVQSVTSVGYVDAQGLAQVLDPSAYELVADPISPVLVGTWPTGTKVEVVYVAGYGDAALVPSAIQSWILLQVGSLYANREAHAIANGAALTLPFAAGLLDPYRIWKAC